MRLSRHSFAALGLATLALAPPAFADNNPVLFEGLQPVYEIGVPALFQITGQPGDLMFLLHSPDPGPFLLPFVGVVDVGPTNLKIVQLGALPPSGQSIFACTIACSPALAAMSVYGQAVTLDLQTFTFCKSNQLEIEFTDGDCELPCSGGVAQLGLQTEICNLPATLGNVLVEVRDASVQPNVVIDLALFTNIDLLNPPALPLVMNGITVTKLDYDAVTNCLLLRFCVDAAGHGQASLPSTTAIMTDWTNCDVEADIPTDCTVPIVVGDTFGAYTVTKLIDLF